MNYTSQTLSIVLLLSSVTLYGKCDEKNPSTLCNIKKSVSTTAYKVKEDIKTGVHDAQEDINHMESTPKNVFEAKQAEQDRAQAARKLKTAAVDTAVAAKETTKEKIQQAKSSLAQKKAENARAQAKQQVKHAAASTAHVIEDKVAASAEAVKEAADSAVGKIKQVYHHARAEHNKNAAKRHARAAVEDARIAIQEEAKAAQLS
jgi:hypothetical protein